MKKVLEKEDVIKNKKASIRELNSLLERYINSGDLRLLKKANLIAYWLGDFAKHVDFETVFEPTRLMSYSRGDVVRLNFGFNIGKEFGGLHLAVVLDNDSKQSADVLTVVPLSSTEGKKVHERSVDLGGELYEKINVVQTKLLANAKNELDEINKMYSVVNSSLELAKANKLGDNDDKVKETAKYLSELDAKIDTLELHIEHIERNNVEIAKLKKGSMAVTNQITTISKQRIYTPKHAGDFLYGISLSVTAMEKINSKIIELYMHTT